MSWTHDFGVVSSADELRRQGVSTPPPAPGVSPEEREAQREMIEAAREMAAVALSSPAFSDAPVAVYASGQANPEHEPYDGRVTMARVSAKGRTFEQPVEQEPSAYEQITVTLQQQPRVEGPQPEVVTEGDVTAEEAQRRGAP